MCPGEGLVWPGCCSLCTANNKVFETRETSVKVFNKKEITGNKPSLDSFVGGWAEKSSAKVCIWKEGNNRGKPQPLFQTSCQQLGGP